MKNKIKKLEKIRIYNPLSKEYFELAEHLGGFYSYTLYSIKEKGSQEFYLRLCNPNLDYLLPEGFLKELAQIGFNPDINPNINLEKTIVGLGDGIEHNGRLCQFRGYGSIRPNINRTKLLLRGHEDGKDNYKATIELLQQYLKEKGLEKKITIEIEENKNGKQK